MANENQILTALGLDLTQYERGVSKATEVNRALVRSIATVDDGLRGIPVLGQVYAGTIGRIVDAFADAVTQEREFARVMRTDVKGSLEGTQRQIEDITDAIKEMTRASFARPIADWLRDAGNKALELVGRTPQKKSSERREEEVLAIEEKRARLIESLIPLYKQEATARSESYSKSVLATDQARIDLDYADRKVRMQKEAIRLFGPEYEKNAAVIQSLKEQEAISKSIQEEETKAANARAMQRKSDLDLMREQAFLQHSGNARDAAEADLKHAKEKKALDIASGSTLEQMQANIAAVSVAEDRLKAAEAEYEFAKHQAELQTKAMDLESRGQTRAANQAKIRLQYENAIADAMRRGNTELADQLTKQQRIAQVDEAKRQYMLGGKGRADERREERKQARIDRTIQSRLKGRSGGDTPDSGLRSDGLTTGGLRAGGIASDREHIPITHMAGPTHMPKPGHMNGNTPKVEIDGMQDFVTKLFMLLGK